MRRALMLAGDAGEDETVLAVTYDELAILDALVCAALGFSDHPPRIWRELAQVIGGARHEMEEAAREDRSGDPRRAPTPA